MTTKQTHFIAMAGLHGCLPNYCEVFGDYDSAVESLAEIHEFCKCYTQELKDNGCIDLDANKYGNSYAEVAECDCNEPWVHSEGMTEDDWGAEHAD